VTKVAFNNCFGGFSLSHAGIMRFAELKGLKLYAFVDARYVEGAAPGMKEKYIPASAAQASKAFCVHYCTTPEFSNETYWSPYDLSHNRADPALIQVIEELGEKANGQCADLKIEDVPAGTLYRIDEYDGKESVMTQDLYEWKIA
jgi:hypothetical protein